MVLPEPTAPAPPERADSQLEEVRSHLTVVLNDLAIARGRIAGGELADVRRLIEEALDYAERLSDMARRPKSSS